MDQIANFIQNNWYELGTLVGQFTLLFAGLWFAGQILKTLRATQQQMGALLRLSMTNGIEEHAKIEERSNTGEANHETTPSVIASSMFNPAPERPASYAAFEKPARTEMPSPSNGSNGRTKVSAPIASEPMTGYPITSAEDPTPYASAPLTLPEERHSLSKGVGEWLQTPMANKRNGGSSLKKVVRWLQAPAR